jgi:hypothetical protein
VDFHIAERRFLGSGAIGAAVSASRSIGWERGGECRLPQPEEDVDVGSVRQGPFGVHR